MIEWLNDVAVPVTYENGVYHITAKPYPNRGPYKSRSEYQEEVIKFIKNNPGKTQNEIRRRLNIGGNTLSPILRELIEQGVITKTPQKSCLKGEGSQYYIV